MPQMNTDKSQTLNSKQIQNTKSKLPEESGVGFEHVRFVFV
jgi:hypothetical protein